MTVARQQSSRVARYNRAVVLDLVRRFGPISKAEPAETALPPQGDVDPDSVARPVVEPVDQVIRLAHVDPGRALRAGVGCPGPVRDGRTVLGAPDLSGWREVLLGERLESALGVVEASRGGHSPEPRHRLRALGG